MPFTMQDINTKLGDLALMRHAHEAATTARKMRREWILSQDEDYQRLEDDVSYFEMEVGRKEEELRGWAMAMNQATGSKRPHPAMGIRVSEKISWDEPKVVAWLVEHNHRSLLGVLPKEFKLVAPVLCPDLITTAPVATATIASDLDVYIPAAPPIEPPVGD